MDNKRFIMGIIVFGSLWGFSECVFGAGINNTGIPNGAIMAGFFALMFLVITRITFQKPGMQLGMGLVAGSLCFFNPFIKCNLCSAIAIGAEGLIFELIWYKITLDLKQLKPLTIQVSLGIISAYLIYVGGYITTQILTKLSTGFYITDLIVILPKILASGLVAAFIGGIVLPITLQIKKIDLTIKDMIYYPISIGVSVICWISVIIILPFYA